MGLVIGIDLGGTETKIGLVDEHGKILNKTTIPTLVSRGREDVVARIANSIHNILDIANEKDKVLAIGIGSPGSIDRDSGKVLFSPNFPDWRDFPLASMIRKHTGLETFIENDANAFILGEWAFGKYKGSKHMIGLTIGTGIGSGVISHGQLITGHNGYAVELGHIIVEPNGPLCGCGSHGCLEAVASATAIVRFAHEYRKRFPDSAIFSSEKIEAKTVIDAAKSGDELGKIIFDRFIDALARGIGGFIHTFNPEVVIVGGGVSKAGDFLLKNLRERVDRYVMTSFKGTAKVDLSDLVEDAGIKGAASIVFYRKR
ncbi:MULTISPECIES: ROK family protein [Kosmotoga]|uniref:Glucokinase n=1 Tax=Kosmotoga olearia (strain ATCC BAA-1733 / DSM 21960 / TBF 19.5.1) TaxID=521045 RepID=C5CGH0_KOSOT|nr:MULTISPECIES: ROK family protein [Kosmotoga]ACR80551.1 ROK family protein [Kosmotoga olearia TBF 19.5.1]MDI3523317.1 glucokinase [Kosmotoga sp.]MDK2952753.1 glucokinase [Kosmotoga sp.]OAA19421.1 glucokinase [Kosmotoga sp. DU53]